MTHQITHDEIAALVSKQRALVAVKIGGVLHTFMFDQTDDGRAWASSEIALLIDALKPNSYAVEFDDVREWVEDHAIVDLSKTGADQYTWDKTNSRVKQQRIRVTVRPQGDKHVRRETLDRIVYKSLD